MQAYALRLLARILKKCPPEKLASADAFHTLEKITLLCERLQGIGSGAHVKESGEFIAIASLLSHAKKDLILFDVGANKGEYTAMLTEICQNLSYTIHAFEPAKATFHMLLQAEAVRAHREKVTLNNYGLGATAGIFNLYSDNEGSGLASLTQRKLEHFDISLSEVESVSLETLDTYCEQNAIDHIDLLKIDVEGHELDVLSGGTNMLSSKRIDTIQFEFGGCNIDTRTYFQDFYYFFTQHGFKLYRITPSGYLYPLDSYKEIYERFTTTSYLAICTK